MLKNQIVLIRTFTHYSVSPCCGYQIRFKGYVEGHFLFSCEKCKRQYEGDSLIRMEEWININRTKLIDKILNDD